MRNIKCIKDEHCAHGEVCLFSGLCIANAYGEGSRCSHAVRCSNDRVCHGGRCRKKCDARDPASLCHQVVPGEAYRLLLKKQDTDPDDCFEQNEYARTRNQGCEKVNKVGEKCPETFDGSRYPCEEGAVCIKKRCVPLCASNFSCEDPFRSCYGGILKFGPFGLCLTDEESAEFDVDFEIFPNWAVALTILGAGILCYVVLLYCLKSLRKKKKRKAAERKRRMLMGDYDDSDYDSDYDSDEYTDEEYTDEEGEEREEKGSFVEDKEATEKGFPAFESEHKEGIESNEPMPYEPMPYEPPSGTEKVSDSAEPHGRTEEKGNPYGSDDIGRYK